MMRLVLSLGTLLLALSGFGMAAGLAGSPLRTPARQAVGDEISYVDQGGKEIGVLFVGDVTDPFTDYDSFFPPPAGIRWVAVEITARATGGRFQLNPMHVRLQTVNGFLYLNDFVFRAADSEAPPDLRLTGLAPGDEATGIVLFAVPEGDDASLVLWQPKGNRLLVLADLAGN